MKLLRLRVRGLRSFTRETEIDLERLGAEGLFAIHGPTGAGKSTILDGVFLALFGRCPRGEASECVSAGALELSVRLELSVGHGEARRDLAVERRFRWGKRRGAPFGAIGSELRGAPRHPPLRLEERRVTAEGVEWVAIDLAGQKPDEHLAEHIVKVSLNDFQQAVVLPQGQFDALLRAKPAERRNLVASLFRTEHLGQPLAEVFKARLDAVRGEMDHLQGMWSESFVVPDEVAAAIEAAREAQADAEASAEELARSERLAHDLQRARARCEARDEAALALEAAERRAGERGKDRARAELGTRAAGAEPAVRELGRAEAEALEAEGLAAATEGAARAAEVHRKQAARVFAEASAARAQELPEVLDRLGRARLALERSADLVVVERDLGARRRDLAAAEKAIGEARAHRDRGARAVEDALEVEAEIEARRARVAVPEDERASAIAAAALAEHAAFEARLVEVIEAEVAAVVARADKARVELARVEKLREGAALEVERRHAAHAEAEARAHAAALEVENVERTLEEARRGAAASELARHLHEGDACPVCGSLEHPGVEAARAGLGARAIELGEKALSAARRDQKNEARAVAAAAAQLSAAQEEGRVHAARARSLVTDLEGMVDLAARIRSGAEVPRSVAEVREGLARALDEMTLELDALSPDEARALRALHAKKSIELAPARARVAALARRAREAEALARQLADAAKKTERARAEAGRLGDAALVAERTRVVAESRLAGAVELIAARREEVRVLVSQAEPRGQRGLFDAPVPVRSAAEWAEELEAISAALTDREAAASAELATAQGDAERLALEARAASARRLETARSLRRARTAADQAIKAARFSSPDDVRRALVPAAELASLTSELFALDREVERLGAVLAERRRDVTVEVSAGEAHAASVFHEEARHQAEDAKRRALESAVRARTLEARKARAVELRAQITALEPRAQRLAQIQKVVSSNQLSELAAERHLEAVTKGAALILGALSNERYALVRTADGAFAVSDGAHGGLVRSPSTLSGGETFLVSLALALSLSERIQLAGRTRFDFFFLDEGFGSLDAVTLDTALGALERLRGPSRVIGMISHVAAIEERMPRRLRVIPGRMGGSTTVSHEP